MNKMKQAFRSVSDTVIRRQVIFVSLTVLMSLSLITVWVHPTLGQFRAMIIEDSDEYEGIFKGISYGGVVIAVQVDQQKLPGKIEVQLVRKSLKLKGLEDKLLPKNNPNQFSLKILVANLALRGFNGSSLPAGFGKAIHLQVVFKAGELGKIRLAYWANNQWNIFPGNPTSLSLKNFQGRLILPIPEEFFDGGEIFDIQGIPDDALSDIDPIGLGN